MIGHLPCRPGGTDPQSILLQYLYDQVRLLRVQDVSTVGIQRTTRGTVIIPQVVQAAKGITVTVARVKTITDEYLICRSWNGKSEGETDILIAKPEELRDVEKETIDGQLVTYSNYDWDAQSRLATRIDGQSETQFIVPRYLTEGETISIVRALPCFTGAEYDTGELTDPDNFNSDPVMAPVTLIDLNIAGRAWAAQ